MGRPRVFDIVGLDSIFAQRWFQAVILHQLSGNETARLIGLRKLADLKPVWVTLLVWLPLITGYAVIAAHPDHRFNQAMGGLLTVTSIYAYPAFLVLMPQLAVSQLWRRVAVICTGAIAALFAAGLVMGGSVGYSEPANPRALAVGVCVGLAIFTPLVIAAHALRKIETAVGRNTPLGLASAFFWFFYWPVGVFFIHKRLRYALHRQAVEPVNL
jgi:quinol-cytochrome oxidoreductase complex cytochrome b subunit